MHIEGSVVREGKTVQVAVEKALRSLGIKIEQADIEVLTEGRSGLLGFGAKEARVRVSIKEEIISELKLQDILVDLDIRESKQKTSADGEVADAHRG